MSAQGQESRGTGRRRRPVWLRVVSGGIVSLLVVVAAIFATRSDGQPVHDVALTDGGLWVSGGRTGYWGRVNTGAHQFDLVLSGAGDAGTGRDVLRADVLQDGRNAVGVTADRRLIAFDTRTGERIKGEVQVPEPTPVTGVDFHEPDRVALGGDTLAVVDHDTGRIWGKRLDPAGGTPIADLLDTGELDTVGKQAAVTVDLDGDIMAVSADSGRVVEIPAEGDGFGQPIRTDLDFSGRAADITAVGDEWVVLDLETGDVMSEHLLDPQPIAGGTQDNAGEDLAMVALQQPGPASDVVGYQTLERAGYARITEDSDHDGADVGVVSGLDEGDERPQAQFNKISRPVVNGDCLYAAWGMGGTILWGRACGQTQAQTSQLPVAGNLTRRNGVAVRHDRGQLVLNDLDTGRVYDLTLPGDLRIDTWPGGAPRGDPERYDPSGWGEDPSPSSTTSTRRPGSSPSKTRTSSPTTSTKTG